MVVTATGATDDGRAVRGQLPRGRALAKPEHDPALPPPGGEPLPTHLAGQRSVLLSSLLTVPRGPSAGARAAAQQGVPPTPPAGESKSGACCGCPWVRGFAGSAPECSRAGRAGCVRAETRPRNGRPAGSPRLVHSAIHSTLRCPLSTRREGWAAYPWLPAGGVAVRSESASSPQNSKQLPTCTSIGREPEPSKSGGCSKLAQRLRAVRGYADFLVSQKMVSISAIRSSSVWASAGSTEPLPPAAPACLVALLNSSCSCGYFSKCGGLK